MTQIQTSIDTESKQSEEVMKSNQLTALDITALFRKHHKHICHFVQRYVRNPEDVEDVVQSTFLEALRCADRYSGLSKPSTWLFGIALNLSRNQVRSNCAILCDLVEESVLEQIPDLHADPANLIEQRQLALKVDTLLAELPLKMRNTFEAVLEGDSTYEEAALQLDVPIGTIRSRVSRVRNSIRDHLST